jgi:8-oxo-dGTP pyrophosphatase MutT (NUDIX family)
VRERWLRVSLSSLQTLLQARLSSRPPTTIEDPETSEAAVAVVIGSNPDSILVIRRAERAGDPWSGHMGLPGGRRAATDLDLKSTAIRETEEEVGIYLSQAWLLGQLDDVAPRTRTRAPIFARPFVFAVDGTPAVSPNSEVSAAFWLPISLLQDPQNYRTITLELAGSSRTFPAYHPSEGVIWGMTERVLTALVSLIS